ncbi:hypothetical protein AB0F46_01855 [Streptomyces sp. NPDC026665]|uniref:hypothetical protein n=1 Tax=Streptomyces sp. NPDC026665 TaxID=3154798 RepID=UPI0033E0767E
MNSSSPMPGPMPPESAPAVAVKPLAQSPTATAAVAVLNATMAEHEIVTGEDLAQAEQDAGILFDPARIEDAVSAAREQARAEYQAEIADMRQHIALMAGSRRQRDAVLRLCEGRRGDELLLVAAIAVAAEAATTAVDGLPMTLTWNGRTDIPNASDNTKGVTIQCTSAYGGRADLVVTGDDRLALASLLNAEARDTSDERLARAWEEAEPVDVAQVDETCRHAQCGTTEDLDGSDPALLGWTRIEVAGVEDEPRWYCSAYCVTSALARAGEELAISDDLAAIGGEL